MYKRKTWCEKLADSKDLPKVCQIEPAKRARFGGARTMVIPAPREVDALMKKVRPGKLITINELRAALARKHKAGTACPFMTGIGAWIAAHAAEESAATGRKRITPYWRTLKSGGELNPKFPRAIGRLKRMLQAEGHRVVVKGRGAFVAEYQKVLAAL